MIRFFCRDTLENFVRDTHDINFKDSYIEKIDNTQYKYDWLAEACMAGNEEIVEYVISKGAKNYNRGLLGACEGGHIDLVKKMIENGAKVLETTLEFAERGGNQEIINLIKLKLK